MEAICLKSFGLVCFPELAAQNARESHRQLPALCLLSWPVSHCFLHRKTFAYRKISQVQSPATFFGPPLILPTVFFFFFNSLETRFSWAFLQMALASMPLLSAWLGGAVPGSPSVLCSANRPSTSPKPNFSVLAFRLLCNSSLWASSISLPSSPFLQYF